VISATWRTFPNSGERLGERFQLRKAALPVSVDSRAGCLVNTCSMGQSSETAHSSMGRLTLKHRHAVLLVVLLLTAWDGAPAQESPRYALVIGNSSYEGFGSLDNPRHDASDMEEVLSGLGFNVTLELDADLATMNQAVVRFGNRLSTASDAVGFLFYAGHGVQSSDGRNYLIPGSANIPSEAFLGQSALSVETVLAILRQAGNQMNIVVLDACRNNPFSWSRSGMRGLAVVGTQPQGSVIAYAAAANQAAEDGEGRNGLYTGALLGFLRQPGLEILDVFRRTGRVVSNATNGAQTPAIYAQLYEDFYLARASGIDVSASGGERAPPLSLETVLVEGGTFQMGSSSGGDDDERPVHTVRLDSFRMTTTEVTFAQYDEFASATGRDLPDDEGWGRGERPVIRVSWYDAVEYANWLSGQDGIEPAFRINGTNVTWERDTNGWRLPTEAEWEYAARGGRNGRETSYAGRNDADEVAWYGDNSGNRTHPAGEKQANEQGLYDMSGNVWEWCWDWFGQEYYADSPAANPAGPSSGSYRVMRGGGWSYYAAYVRVASRDGSIPRNRYDRCGGFRLVAPAVQ
jgi:formylglycine-generating enzyme required for sulfatase activity